MAVRTFVVTVSEAPKRVVVEDVSSQRREVGDELEDVGRHIGRLLEQPTGQPDGPPPVSES